jgi:hypothetical protein
MKNIFKIIVLATLVILAVSCKDDAHEKAVKQTKKPLVENYNISILLDLSDRISIQENPNPTMEYYQRDLGYIKSISEAFTQHVRTKRVHQINDKLQLFFNPEPLNSGINSISKNLRISIDKNNAKKEFLNSINSNYAAQTAKIYDLALKDKNYIGSDIWRFFENKVKDQCIDTTFRNILIIVTDGYLFHEDTKLKEDNLTSYITPGLIKNNGLNTKDWKKKMSTKKYGFIKANDNLSGLEILVLGVNPDKKNPYEGKVIKEYWSNWFAEMKVKRFEIKNADLPSNMEKVIKDFILNPT